MTDEELFQQAVNLSESQQADFLRSACGDDTARRRRLMRLLSSAGKGDELLDTEAMSTVTSMETGVPHQLGDFTLGRLLGRGGMGVVYEAKQKSLNRTVALKLLSSGLGLSSRAILRFRREAEAAGKLHHTNIVPIYTTGEENGIHFYAMELIDGPSLDQVIRDLRPREGRDAGPSPALRGRLSQRESELQNGDDHSSISATSSFATRSNRFDDIAAKFAEVADALDHAHEHGVIHRDIKPSNLLLRPDGQLSVNDFGLARMLEQPGMTMTGEFVGSPLYMSPDQIAAGRTPIDHRTDIYSLGATLYEMLTLQPPFPGESRDQVLTGILHKEAKSTRKIDRRIPVDLDTICMKAIAKDPDKRYQTAGKLAEDLRAYVNRHAISARRIGVVGKAEKLVRRNPVAAAFAGLLGVALLAVVMLYAWERKQDRLDKIDNLQTSFLEHFLRGDQLNMQRVRRELVAARAPTEMIDFASGCLNYLNGDYELAQDEFADLDSVAAKAMRSLCVRWLGDETRSIGLLPAIDESHVLSIQDQVLLGRALEETRPNRAFAMLQDANSRYPNTQLIKLGLGTAARVSAREQLNLNIAQERIKLSLKYLQEASSNLNQTATTIQSEIYAKLDYLDIHRRIPNQNVQLDASAIAAMEEIKHEIRELFETLQQWEDKVESRTAMVYVMLEPGNEDLLTLHSSKWQKDNDELGFYAAQALAIKFLERHEYETAKYWRQMAKGPGFRMTNFIDWSIVLMESKGTAVDRLRTESSAAIQRLTGTANAGIKGFDVPFAYMLGNSDALAVTGTYGLHPVNQEDYGVFTEYFRPRQERRIDANQLLERCERVERARETTKHAYFFLALEALGDRQTTAASDYFKRTIEIGGFDYYVHWLAKAFLSHKSDWPAWFEQMDKAHALRDPGLPSSTTSWSPLQTRFSRGIPTKRRPSRSSRTHH